MPDLRQTSWTFRPASASLGTPTICSSVNRLFRMSPPSRGGDCHFNWPSSRGSPHLHCRDCRRPLRTRRAAHGRRKGAALIDDAYHCRAAVGVGVAEVSIADDSEAAHADVSFSTVLTGRAADDEASAAAAAVRGIPAGGALPIRGARRGYRRGGG